MDIKKETKRLGVNIEDIALAGEIIRAGGLVAFPTETVYGLGADALNAEAVASVYRAKGRPSDNPMIVHIAELEGLEGLIDLERSKESKGRADGFLKRFMDAFGDAYKAAEALWPGPLTMIFPKSSAVPPVTTGGLATVAVRMPSSEAARALIRAAGRPVAAPSANLSGRPSPTTAQDVLEDMDGRIDAVIMGEQCDIGIESTVLDMTGEVPEILRPGAVTAEMLTEILGREVIYNRALLEKPAVTIDPAAAIADAVPTTDSVDRDHTVDRAAIDDAAPSADYADRDHTAARDPDADIAAQGSVGDHAAANSITAGNDANLAVGKVTSAAAKVPAAIDDAAMTGQDNAPDVPVARSSDALAATDQAAAFRPKSPGMKYTHYSPKARVRLIAGNPAEFKKISTAIRSEAEADGKKTAIIDYGSDAAKAAHELFADLRELDRQGCELILIRALDEEGMGLSVMNRMLKSAGYDVIR